MEFLKRLEEFDFQGITAADVIVVVGILLVAFIVRKIFQTIVVSRMTKLAERTKTDLDDHLVRAVERPIGLLIILFGFHIVLALLGLPQEPINVRRFFRLLLLVMVTVDITWLLVRLTDVFAVVLARLTLKTDSSLDDQLVPLIRKAIKVGLGIIAFVLVVQNMGYKVTGLLAGLGIGGLAFALAAQSTLANLFGSITIILDRPFRVGDLIEGSGFFGVVEEIGLRSTRVRTLEKTLVTVPNSVLANMTVDNLSARPQRRVRFQVGVTYDADATAMERAVGAIREIVSARPDVAADSITVRFKQFGDSSLDILVQFLTPVTDWGEYMKLVEEVNLAIMRTLADLGMEVAFPSRTIYLKGGDAETL